MASGFLSSHTCGCRDLPAVPALGTELLKLGVPVVGENLSSVLVPSFSLSDSALMPWDCTKSLTSFVGYRMRQDTHVYLVSSEVLFNC